MEFSLDEKKNLRNYRKFLEDHHLDANGNGTGEINKHGYVGTYGMQYEGNWLYGVREGMGVAIFENGDFFEGKTK